MFPTTLSAICLLVAFYCTAGAHLSAGEGQLFSHDKELLPDQFQVSAGDANFLLQVSAGGHTRPALLRRPDKADKIPWQLVMTGKEESLEQLPDKLRRNVKKMLALNTGMKIRYLSDRQCQMYVQHHCGDEMLELYNAETAGHFRGDICRAAVLLEEGGFYADLDLEPTTPFKSLVDDSTKFMSVFTKDGAILNALMAAVPGSPVMKETLLEVQRWYKGGHEQKSSEGQWMGTVTLKRALQTVMGGSCPEVMLESQHQSSDLQWNCGNHAFRFYHEDKLNCNGHAGVATEECPQGRMKSKFDGLKYGIFAPGTARKLVAWSRSTECNSWWCGGR